VTELLIGRLNLTGRKLDEGRDFAMLIQQTGTLLVNRQPRVVFVGIGAISPIGKFRFQQFSDLIPSRRSIT